MRELPPEKVTYKGKIELYFLSLWEICSSGFSPGNCWSPEMLKQLPSLVVGHPAVNMWGDIL